MPTCTCVVIARVQPLAPSLVCPVHWQLMYKLGLLQALRLRWSERKTLQAERTRLLASFASVAAASVSVGTTVPNLSPLQAGIRAGLPDPNPEPPAPEPDHANNQLITDRNAPPPLLPPAIGAALISDGSVTVRGMCDGCGTNVMSTDEGRRREGAKYFHEACVRGDCGHCGLIVHARTLHRELRNGIYYHPECVDMITAP